MTETIADGDPGESDLEESSHQLVAGLQEALLRLTEPGSTALRSEIETLRDQIEALAALEANLERLQKGVARQIEEGDRRTDETLYNLWDVREQLRALTADLQKTHRTLEDQLESQDLRQNAEVENLRQLVQDLEQVRARVRPVLTSLIHDRARAEEFEFAEAVAPVMGPAIRHQIREAQQDIIDAFYPVIGQIINKAISEAMRELTAKIDSRLRPQIDFGTRVRWFFWRLRGVSEAELILREAVPYEIHHIFLVHRETGLLLAHREAGKRGSQAPELISGMLTAIRDFVADSFGQADRELEDITYGDQRILLEAGQNAYLAVVLEGVEPPGYANVMRTTLHQIGVQYERDLRRFWGDMDLLPDFTADLKPLSDPSPEDLVASLSAEELSPGERRAMMIGALVLILILALIVFAVIFIVRLWPVAFGPAPT